MTQHSPPAGWYEHPGGGIRWWDGAAWTAHRHEGQVPAAPAAPLSSVPSGAPSPLLTAPAQHDAGAEELWDYGATQPEVPAPKGTGLYRELSARTTGIVMIVCSVPVLGWLLVAPFLTGGGIRVGLGFGLWIVGGFALLAGGVERLARGRRDGATDQAAATTPAIDFGGAPAAVPAAAPAYVGAAPPEAAWAPSSTQPATPHAAAIPAATAVPYTGYGKQPRSGYVGVGSRGWVLAVLGLIALLLVGYAVVASRSSADDAVAAGTAPAAAAPAKPKPAKAAKPWAPKGYTQLAGGVAWKKTATMSKDCATDTACARIAVMTKASCPMVRVEVAFRDTSKNELGSAVAYAKRLKPKQAKVVRVSSPNAEEARYFTLTSAKCMDAA